MRIHKGPCKIACISMRTIPNSIFKVKEMIPFRFGCIGNSLVESQMVPGAPVEVGLPEAASSMGRLSIYVRVFTIQLGILLPCGLILARRTSSSRRRNMAV